jgi:hypothetical protein
MTLSGLRQRIAAPVAPGCFPRFRFFSARSAARRSFRAGCLRPGRSSLLGGIEEFPEFRDPARAAASSCSRSSATSASSAAIRSACSRINASRGSSGGNDSGTAPDHPGNQPGHSHDTPPAAQP